MRPVTMSLNVFKYQKNKISTLKRRHYAKTHHRAVIFYYLDSLQCILLCICIPWQVFIKHSICCVRPALRCTCETSLHTLNNSHLFLYLVLSLYFVFVFSTPYSCFISCRVIILHPKVHVRNFPSHVE